MPLFAFYFIFFDVHFKVSEHRASEKGGKPIALIVF